MYKTMEKNSASNWLLETLLFAAKMCASFTTGEWTYMDKHIYFQLSPQAVC